MFRRGDGCLVAVGLLVCLSGLAQVVGAETAVYDPAWAVPTCVGRGSYVCDSGALLVGRGQVGFESHAPNTLGATCADGSEGEFHVDPSIDRILVVPTDFGAAQVEVTVFVASAPSAHRVTLYVTGDAHKPEWQWADSFVPLGIGEETFSASVWLPPDSVIYPAIRATMGDSLAPPGACNDGPYDDTDDLIWNYPGIRAHDAELDAELGSPVCALFRRSTCDSGDLLTGRGLVGPEPHAPNTTIDVEHPGERCLDGDSGTFHVDRSIESIQVHTINHSELREGEPAYVDVTVWASEDFANERLDLFSGHQGSLPLTPIGSASPVRPGPQVLTLSFVPDNLGPLFNVRAAFRNVATPPTSPCSSSELDDQDDLAFWVDLVSAHYLVLQPHGEDGGQGTLSAPGATTCSTLDQHPWPCAGQYDDGSTVSISATPSEGSVFLGWGGDCAGVEAPTCELAMTYSRVVSARFGPAPALSIGNAAVDEDDSGAKSMTLKVTLE